MPSKLTQFVNEVRQEVSKVTWATRKETLVSTLMVLTMVTIVAIFFLLVDMVIFKSVQFVLGI